mmetsp:Transcript_48090/g.58238  ORF Transcript_48090/g.58238 Transcript_48090/m.58238 type:complete len:152 (-) Transcript_48090:70-525(-)
MTPSDFCKTFSTALVAVALRSSRSKHITTNPNDPKNVVTTNATMAFVKPSPASIKLAAHQIVKMKNNQSDTNAEFFAEMSAAPVLKKVTKKLMNMYSAETRSGPIHTMKVLRQLSYTLMQVSSHWLGKWIVLLEWMMRQGFALKTRSTQLG